jgi:hypothetical protein
MRRAIGDNLISIGIVATHVMGVVEFVGLVLVVVVARLRQMAEAFGVSHNTVHQIWRSFGIKPHRKTAFDLPVDPLTIDKVWDVVGLYLKPPV